MEQLKENILFPAFVSLYQDQDNTYVYYFRGLTETNKWIFQDFDESEMVDCHKILNEDGSIIYQFDKSIKSIQCNLISNFSNIQNKQFFLKLI